MVIVFDLDDTLYDELSYVKSGLRAAASFLARKRDLSAEDVYADCARQLEQGRSGVFDAVLQNYGIYSKRLVRECVGVYRTHMPDITLWPEAKKCLGRFGDDPVYIVTDGNQTAQKNKLVALGLYKSDRVRFCYLTYRYGKVHSKPSPYCFEKIVMRERCSPREVAYVGDNPQKDFVGLNPLGFLTVRVLTGQHRSVRVPSPFRAKRTIDSLEELTRDRLASWVGQNAECAQSR